MSVEQPKPKRRGRPPKDASGGETGRAAFHIGLRLQNHRRDELLRLVAAANERARVANVPGNITPSGLVTMWVLDRIDAEIAKLAKKK